MIKILLVDDHTLIRQGVRKILEEEQDFEIVGEAGNGLEALDIMEVKTPDIVIMDLMMPEMTGMETLKKINELEISTKVMILTVREERSYLFEALNLGAKAYILKSTEAEGFKRAIREVHKGGTYVHPTLASELVKDFNKPPQRYRSKEERMKHLTRREQEVLGLIAEGMNNREIANHLFISEKTVKNHVSNIFKKINVNDRTQAAIYAIKNKEKQ